MEKHSVFVKENISPFLFSINSYFGIIKHYSIFKLREKMLVENLSPHFGNYIYIADDYAKLVSKN